MDHAEIYLSDEALRLLLPEMAPETFLDCLLAAEFHADAIRLLSHLLPKQAAVWWGCLCAWQLARPEKNLVETDALHAAAEWVMLPSEENRRGAEGPGGAATMQTPAGCLAMAAFWSGGSMIGPELPKLPPPADASARLVSGAILTAVLRQEPSRWRESFGQVLAVGKEILHGRCLWPEAAATTEESAPASRWKPGFIVAGPADVRVGAFAEI